MTAKVQAELHWLHSADLWDLKHGMPEDPECFGISVQAMIGARGEDGEESFDFLVCTPRWLADEVARERYALGRHHLFLPRYDYALMQRAIEDVCARATGPDWDTVAGHLARYGLWEFEDYREYQGDEATAAGVVAVGDAR